MARERKERLFGATGSGRATKGSTGVKLETLGKDYKPREDTCIKAFIRLLVENAMEAAPAATEVA